MSLALFSARNKSMKKTDKLSFGLQLLRISLTIFISFVAVSIHAANITSNTTGNWSATAWPNTGRTGSITTSTSSLTVTGSSTLFTTELSAGNIIKSTSNTVIGTVASITDNTHLTLLANAASNYSGISFRSQGVGPVDAVTIASGANLTVDGIFRCASVSFSSVTANTTVSISNTNSLTISGALSMARPSNGITCTFNVGSGSLTAASLTMKATTSGRNNIISVASGTITINGSLTTGTSGCLITFTGAGTFNIDGSFSSSPAITQFTGNTWNYTGSAQTVKAITYNNLILSGSGVKTMTGVKVNGVLSIEESATVSAAPTYGSGATLQYNTAIDRTAGAEWIDSFSSSGGIIIANSGIITLNSSEILSSPLKINMGASLNTNSAKNYSMTFADNFVNDGTFIANASSISFSGTANQSISGFSTTGAVSMIKTAGTAVLTGNINGSSLILNGSGGTLNLGPDLVHTITGDWTRTAGTLNGNSSTLNIGGNVTNTAGLFTPGTSTVNYNGTIANQVIASVNYYNLTLSGSGIKTMQSATSLISNNLTIDGGASVSAVTGLGITGDLSIGSGASFSCSTFSHNLAGDLIINGTFNSGSGTINLNGISNQIISATDLTILNNLTISNASGVTLANDVSVIGSLAFSNGKISTLGNRLKLGKSAVITGAGNGEYISGNLEMGIAQGATSKKFEIGDENYYVPVTIVFTGTTNNSGSFTVRTDSGNIPDLNSSNINPALNVNRYWSIINEGVTDFTSYDVTFNFVAGDMDTGADFASFIAGQFYSSAWSYPETGVVTASTLQVSGLTGSGEFQTGEPSSVISASYNNNGNTPAISNIIPVINMPSTAQVISTTFSAHQYFTMNVIKGITYEVYTANITAPANPLMISVYKEDAPSDPAIAFSSANTGNPGSSAANNVYSSFTPSFSGLVRVLVNRKANFNSLSPGNLTIIINVKDGSNSLDNQTGFLTDKWVGHLYDGNNFNNYLGYYTTPGETFQESFGTGGTWPDNTNDDVACFSVLSGGNVRASLKDVSFSVRYRMKSSKRGLFTASITSDDGSRLLVDGSGVFFRLDRSQPKSCK